VGRWARIDRRYNQPYRLTGYAVRAIFKWTGLVLAWAFVNSVLAAIHLGALVLATTAGLIWYGVHCARRNRGPQLTQPTYSRVMPTASQWPSMPTVGQWQVNVPPMPTVGLWQFNAPPNWPLPPPGWSPGPGWQPDPAWPPAPHRWHFWAPCDLPELDLPTTPPARGAPGERNSRVIPQDVKIAVSVRDQGKCVQCGSTDDLHFDHKVPYSRGGTNTVNNIQLLCGPCNRRKGADDIPF
jgi:HNH endonuclease